MTDVAYILFTFMACLVGLGIGLLLNHLWSAARSTNGEEASLFAATDEETGSFEAFAKWQAANNRRFAVQVISCGAAPLIFAGAAWSQRSDVVHVLCHNVVQAVGQAYICM
jgi:hypothetical protein